MDGRRVVVTGIGAITPVGHTQAETWDALVGGRSGVGQISLFDASDQKVTLAAEVHDFDPEQYFDRKTVRRYDRFSQFALIAAAEALADSGIEIDPDSELAARSGAVMGVGFGGMQTFIDEIDTMRERGPTASARSGSPRSSPTCPPGWCRSRTICSDRSRAP